MKPPHRLLLAARVPDAFWSLWGGRVLSCLFLSAIVACALKPFHSALGLAVDSIVQASLLQELQAVDRIPAECTSRSGPCLQVIGIDADDYRNRFGQRSPLDADELRRLIDGLREAPPRVLAIDLDLSPASPSDWPARRRLLASLEALAQSSEVVMVCPHGYSIGDPGPLDRQWVREAGRRLAFASGAISEGGLYYSREGELATLGVAAMRAAAGLQEDRPAPDWDRLCQDSWAATARPANLQLIRPAFTISTSFSEAVQVPRDFQSFVVFLGGRWGSADLFHLRGVDESVHGVTLHAWVAATEKQPPYDPSTAATTVIDVIVGLSAGAFFAWVWGKIISHRQSFGLRSMFYAVFLASATLIPLLWVMAAARLAQLGVVFGAAGMLISSAADVFLSAHEDHLSEKEAVPGVIQASQRGPWVRAALGCIALFGAALALVMSHTAAACAAAGAMAGTALACIDLGSAQGSPENHRDESNFDLLMRLAWLLARIGVLVYVAWVEFDTSAYALVIGFFAAWTGVLLAGRRVPKINQRGQPPASAAVPVQPDRGSDP